MKQWKCLNSLTHTVNFGIGSAFSKSPGSTFSEGLGLGPGPLYKVCPYVLKIPITLKKNWTPLLFFYVSCISVRSAPQILSLKGEYTLWFWIFPIIDLCNSYLNCWFS